MTLEITKITLIENPYSGDTIILDTNLPAACYPFAGYLQLEFQGARGQSSKYLEKHFPGVNVTKTSYPEVKE